MRRWSILFLLLMVAVAVFALAGRLAPKPVKRVDTTELDQVVAEWLAASGAAGVAVVAYRDGALALERTWGRGSVDGRLTIGSASKWVSAAVALSLVDSGHLGLDEPLSEHLPELRGGMARITLRQALAHTSGLHARDACIRDYDVALRDCARTIASKELLREPGTTFAYGSVSYHLVGAAAEVATGRTWRELFRERIADPLGWTATDYGRTGRSPNPGVAGNLTTTAREYGRFVQMVLEGGTWRGRRVLSEGGVGEMLAGQAGGLAIGGHVPRRLQGVSHDPYGLGVWRDVVDEDGELVVASADGKFGFVPWLDREHGVAAVFATEFHSPELAAQRPSPQRAMALVTEAVVGRRPVGTRLPSVIQPAD